MNSRGLYATSIFSALLLALWHLNQLAEEVTPSTWVYVVAGIGVGALGADLVTGLVHWACDTWADEQTPWVGVGLIQGFREHHREPDAMVEHDWIEVNGEVATAACAGFGLLTLPASQSALGGHVFVYACLYSLISLVALTNQLHKWAHMCEPPVLIRMLQRTGLILSPARHSVHHSALHTSSYCISTGWLNGPLDAVGFWRILERTITHATGVEPRADSVRTGK
jgi:ubiquitin-conjugating enzyme E2 variant